jgi:hypothetical protein
MRDWAADCPKEILKWSRFCHFGRGEQSQDRQPDDNCADRPFHNDEGYCFASSRESHQPIATRVFWLQIAHAKIGKIGFNLITQKFRSRSRDAVIRVYDEAGNVIETHESAGDLKEWWGLGVCTSQRQKMACSKMSKVIKGRSARNSESEVNSDFGACVWAGRAGLITSISAPMFPAFKPLPKVHDCTLLLPRKGRAPYLVGCVAEIAMPKMSELPKVDGEGGTQSCWGAGFVGTAVPLAMASWAACRQASSGLRTTDDLSEFLTKGGFYLRKPPFYPLN